MTKKDPLCNKLLFLYVCYNIEEVINSIINDKVVK